MSEESLLTLSVPAAGKKYFGLSRNGAYDAAKRGELPVIKIGRKLFVPIRALEAMLDRARASRRYERRDLPPMRQAVAGDCSAPCSFLFSGPSGGLSPILDRRRNGPCTVSGGAYAR